MMYGDPQPPPPVQHPPPLPPQQHHQQFQYQPRMGDFPMGQQQQQQPPLPPPMMRQPSASSTTLGAPQDYNYPSAQPPHPSYNAQADSFSANRMRKMGQRRTVDYTSTVVRYMQIRMYQRDSRDKTILQPTPAAAIDMLPTVAYSDNASINFAAKFVHTSINKNRCSINRVLWTPTGRRLITGSQSGELTLWNGQAFNFEMVLQAHDQPIRSMVWSYNDNWMVTGDDGGTIKYWQNNMNNVKVNKSGHNESVRDLSFCRTDLKFCSCSDDGTVKVWDFARCAEDRSLSGHGWNVMSVDWHPTKSLLVSGGKDNLVKLWDAKSGKELHSFVGHKNNVLNVKWNQNGNWVLSASKDQIIKLYDIRSMKELQSFHGHQKDVTTLAWHPFQEEYFVSGSLDGSIFHWLVGHDNPQVEIPNAHDNIVWDLSWHPIGYLLCSGSNDQTTKFWCRNRPGDQARENFNPGHNRGGYGEQNLPLAGNFSGSEPPTTIPGTFGGGLSRNEGTIPGIGVAMQLDTSVQGEQKPPAMIGLMPSGGLPPPPLPPGPHPSLFAGANQQQAAYQQNVQQQHHQIHHQQHQMTSLPRPPPPNFQQLQTPPQFPPHPPHLPHPPAQLPPMPMQGGPMGMRGTMNHQMVPPMPQAHFMNMNHNVQSGSLGGIPNVMQNMQGPPNGSVNQMYSVGGGFNRPQSGQMPAMPGNAAVNSSMGTLPPPSFGMHPPLPPGPPPRGQTPQ